jgi:Domain of Unknown Function (DUF1259)
MNVDRATFFLPIALAVAFGSACAESPAPPPISPTTAVANAPAPASAPATAAPAAPPPAGTGNTMPPAVATPKAPLDPARIAAATGGKPETSDNVVKVSFPRDDVRVEVDGWNKMPPFMGLTSWAAFIPGEKPGVEAMVTGDMVLFEDEVNTVMTAALDSGLEVTALHNHFFFDKPRVFFMHIGGEGTAEQLGKGVRAALDAEQAVRKKAPQPATAFGAPPPMPSKIDAAKLDAVFGAKGATKDGMYKGTFGRKTQAECGCTIGKAMGVNTWAAFAGSDENAVVDGDFSVAESELQAVLKTLRGGGINIVTIHSHMTNESPRLLFLHYWGRGRAADLANVVKRALDLTAWDGRAQST